MLSVGQIKERIISYVAYHPGCTAIQLMTRADIADEDHNLDLPVMLETMVNNGELAELECRLSAKTYQMKSLFFVKNSNITFTPTNDGQIEVVCDGVQIQIFPKNTIFKLIHVKSAK